jgi:hypothetical protein
MFRKPQTAILSCALVALVSLLAVPALGQHRTYWRDTDPAGQSPRADPTGWTDLAGGNTGQVSILPGKSIYFGAMNNPVDAKKVLTLTMSWMGSNHGNKRSFAKPTATGYRNGLPVAGYISTGTNKNKVKASWDSCPEWEYIEFKNFKSTPQTVQIHAKFSPTKCQDVATSASGAAGDTHDTLDITDSACGVVGEMDGPLRMTEIEIYPEHQAVNQAVAPSFSAEPHTGEWTTEFSFIDPFGTPRPGGGARFSTDGIGLSVEDLHGLSVTMLDSADTRYTLFAWDEQLGEWHDYIIDLRVLPWYEDFEIYAAEELLHGASGWAGWDDDPAFDAPVTDAISQSAPFSLDVGGDADIVREFEGADSGVWSFEAWQYIPSDFVSGGGGQFDGSYFIVMNTYAAGEAHEDDHWSVQVQFDSNDGMCKVFHGEGLDTIAVPYVTDRWVKIQAEIDLDDDWTRIYYDDTLVTEYSWTGGVLGDGAGALDIAAVDLFGQGSTSIYYDDLVLVPIVKPCRADFNSDGQVNTLDVLAFLNAWGAGDPSADFNGDGSVNTLDVLAFLNAWSSGC